MRSRSIRQYKEDEGVAKAMLAMGVTSPQAVYHAINSGRRVQVIELDGWIEAVETRTLNKMKGGRL